MYPVWPSKASLDRFRTQITKLDPSITTRLFKNLVRIHRTIPIYSGYLQGIPIFIKEEFSDLGRGAFENELEIGDKVNELREICPNFITTLVWTSGNVRSLITEMVPGPTFQEYLREKPSFLKVFSVFVQTILALELAHKTLGLVHGDLLSSNIIVRKLPEVRTVEYSGLYLETDQIPVIYDFDRSSLKGNLQRDIYTLLFSTFRNYPLEFQKLLSWYGVNFKTGIKHSEIINRESPKLILRTGLELIRFGKKKFKFQLGNCFAPLLVPDDILPE